jgi:hypothetical protein
MWNPQNLQFESAGQVLAHHHIEPLHLGPKEGK